MPAEKEHREFFTIDLTIGWEVPPGYPKGIEQKILSGSLDETSQRGNHPRLLRFQPGVYTTAPFVHGYCEEIYLLSGDLIVGNDQKWEAGIPFGPHIYACRPSGTFPRAFQVGGRMPASGDPFLRVNPCRLKTAGLQIPLFRDQLHPAPGAGRFVSRVDDL